MALASRRKIVGTRRRATGEINSNWMVGAGAVGVFALGYHGPGLDMRQTTYGSREQCQQDWGSPADCVDSGNHTYVGPRYYWDSRRNLPVIVDPNGSERAASYAHVGRFGGSFGRTAVIGRFSRGGFGGIGRGFGAGRGG